MKKTFWTVKWDKKREMVEYIAGQFYDYVNAQIFCRAYNEYYKVDSYVKCSNSLYN